MLLKPNHRWDSETNPGLQCRSLELWTATVLPNKPTKPPYSLCEKLRTFLCWKKKSAYLIWSCTNTHTHTHTHTHTQILTDDFVDMTSAVIVEECQISAQAAAKLWFLHFNLIISSNFAGPIGAHIRDINFGCVCMIVFRKADCS